MSLLIATTAVAIACTPPQGAGEDVRSQHVAYAERSIEIVALAAVRDETALTSFVSSDVEFSFFSGDVGIPLGLGVDAAYEFADRVKAQSFSFSGWDYMDYPQDPCGEIKANVRFIGADDAYSVDATFEYRGGMLVSAGGSFRTRNVGPMPRKS